MSSSTRHRIERFAQSGTIAVYFLVWATILCIEFRMPYLLLALVTAATYVGMHIFVAVVRGRCLLEAEPAAFIVAIGVFVVLLVAYAKAGTIHHRESSLSSSRFWRLDSLWVSFSRRSAIVLRLLSVDPMAQTATLAPRRINTVLRATLAPVMLITPTSGMPRTTLRPRYRIHLYAHSVKLRRNAP
ncbi:MAG: hypothetical protein HZB26_11895 [Candidatus Hydrogenedentes bacterium]|nr:hypothetical protein [Candidatus Hydrogenedentota bacterium]